MLQTIRVNNKLYEVKRVYRRSEYSNEQRLIEIKNNFKFDTIIKNDEFYFLCNEIPEATFIEILPEENKKNNEINI